MAKPEKDANRHKGLIAAIKTYWETTMFAKYSRRELWDLACRADQVQLDQIKKKMKNQ